MFWRNVWFGGSWYEVCSNEPAASAAPPRAAPASTQRLQFCCFWEKKSQKLKPHSSKPLRNVCVLLRCCSYCFALVLMLNRVMTSSYFDVSRRRGGILLWGFKNVTLMKPCCMYNCYKFTYMGVNVEQATWHVIWSTLRLFMAWVEQFLILRTRLCSIPIFNRTRIDAGILWILSLILPKVTR